MKREHLNTQATRSGVLLWGFMSGGDFVLPKIGGVFVWGL